MKINNKHFKLVFLAGIVLGFLPILFGGLSSKAVAPSSQLRPDGTPVEALRTIRMIEQREMRRQEVLESEKKRDAAAAAAAAASPVDVSYGECARWMTTALVAGWPKEEWATVDRVMFRESRCSPMAFNDTDPNGGSWGLMQINGFWCKPNRWTERGFLQDRGVLNSCDELFDPYVNMTAALAIWMYGEEEHGCGWKGPWLISCKR